MIMHCLWVALACVVLASKVAVCDYTFSMKISTVRCCTTDACENVSTCGERYFVLCLRPPNTSRENRQTCNFFFSNNGSELIDKELIRKDFKPVGATTVTEPYAGGFQVYIAVLFVPDLPPFRPPSIIMDEVFIEAESVANTGEIPTSPVTGQNMLVTISMSLRVDCVQGFGGLGCDTIIYMCRDGITCDSTIGYCNSQGECVCHEGVMEAICVKNDDGRGSADGGSDSNIVPIAVGASVGGFLLLLLLLFIVVVAVVLIFRKKRRKNPGDLYMLSSSSQYSSASHSTPSIPLYSKVNKDKKKRDEPPPIVPPYRGSYIPYYDKSDVRVPDVTYAKTIQEDSGYHNAVIGTENNGTEAQRPKPKPRSRKGMVYAELDHEDITTTTFQGSSSSQQLQGEIVKYSDIASNASRIYENVRKIDKPETMYFEVKN